MDNAPHKTTYHIQVEGRLSKRWADWFDGMRITYSDQSLSGPVTMLEGQISDQSALRGILINLWDLNFILISVERIVSDHIKEKENG